MGELLAFGKIEGEQETEVRQITANERAPRKSKEEREGRYYFTWAFRALAAAACSAM